MSYLQCVCAAQSVKPDPEHICYMLQENNRDVRRSVLELEFWVRSGAGNTHHHLRDRALTVSVIHIHVIEVFTPFYKDKSVCACLCVLYSVGPMLSCRAAGVWRCWWRVGERGEACSTQTWIFF